MLLNEALELIKFRMETTSRKRLGRQFKLLPDSRSS